MDLFSFTVLGCTLLGPLTIGEMGGKDELNMMEWPPYSSEYFAMDIPTSPYKSKRELNDTDFKDGCCSGSLTLLRNTDNNS